MNCACPDSRGEEPYVPASALELLYPVTASFTVTSSCGDLTRIHRGRSPGDAVVRAEPSIYRAGSPLSAGSTLELFQETEGWVQVHTGAGIAG